jgi:anhydro-N-acetylmuramic acid kinase
MIMKKYTVIGLMSGTSLDGLDIALCRFQKNGKWNFRILEAKTIPYSKTWKKKITQAPQLSAYNFLQLHKQYGKYLGDGVNKFLSHQKITPDFIASHGHTIFHEPQQQFNFQLGDGAFIAATTGITTISDFRTLDIAFGGQGAPLVPIGDELLFGNYDYCLNLGGIANISFKKGKKRIAFDVCPANMVLNALAHQLNLSYDKDGKLARKGTLNKKLLDELNKLDYYSAPYPKSLGREWVETDFFPVLKRYHCSTEDKLATVCEHIAIQIGKNVAKKGEILVTGGGAYNKFLISRIQHHIAGKIIIPGKAIIEFKEAIIFAFLGLLRWLGEPNVLTSVTGASKNLSCGIIHKV